MTQNPNNDRNLKSALEHADRLAQLDASRPIDPNWSAQAAHVGDLSVLLLALRG
jgi:hypothetical protein